MKFLEGVSIALKSLLANKLRSILTLIGVIIGVMAVIAVTSIIAGMNKYVANELSAMGSDTFFINKIDFGVALGPDDWMDVIRRKDITMKDMEVIREGCAYCDKVGASIDTRERVKRESRYLDDVLITGATANLVEMMDVQVEQGEGRYISRFEEEHNQPVAFVSWEIKDKLFPLVDPIGKEIKIKNKKFEIVGVAKKKGSSLGQSQDNFVHIPIGAFYKYFGRHKWYEEGLWIYVKPKSFELINEAMDQARVILRARRHVPYDKKDDFGIMTSESFMNLYKQFTSAAFLTMIGISSIALLVGGIVIMNIMLVSVTERTREIGIRKALGARRRDVLWQFLVESVTLALTGGIIGVLLGIGVGQILAMVSPLPAAVDLFWIGIGLFSATSIGLFFGVYPAMKAARLNPIEALRYE
ncbi:MAG: ABC transporter permease [candidate division Zixibacteria bacterium]|nr:ABC transporter permease [candidate division Zixibacteria bacterium]